MSKIQISKAMTNARGTACKYNESPGATVHITEKDYQKLYLHPPYIRKEFPPLNSLPLIVYFLQQQYNL